MRARFVPLLAAVLLGTGAEARAQLPQLPVPPPQLPQLPIPVPPPQLPVLPPPAHEAHPGAEAGDPELGPARPATRGRPQLLPRPGGGRPDPDPARGARL